MKKLIIISIFSLFIFSCGEKNPETMVLGSWYLCGSNMDKTIEIIFFDDKKGVKHNNFYCLIHI
jgi:hypothetical protein